MKKIVKNLPGLCWILVGNLIYAVIVVLFVLPGQLISCGTTGLALVAQQLWGIPVSGFVFVFNVAMLLLGLAFLGEKCAMTTVLSSLLYPVLLSGVQALLGAFRVTEDLLLCALFGGMGLGIALGIVIRAGASTGGMDIPPLILNKLFGIPVPISLWLFDFAIMLSQMFFHTPEDLLYGIIMLIAVNFTLNKTLTAGTGRTEVKIVSEKAREICESILCNADRGVTLLEGKGAWSGKDKRVILCAFGRRQIIPVKKLVQAVDPNAFVIVCDAHEILGEGFGTYDPTGL